MFENIARIALRKFESPVIFPIRSNRNINKYPSPNLAFLYSKTNIRAKEIRRRIYFFIKKRREREREREKKESAKSDRDKVDRLPTSVSGAALKAISVPPHRIAPLIATDCIISRVTSSGKTNLLLNDHLRSSDRLSWNEDVLYTTPPSSPPTLARIPFFRLCKGTRFYLNTVRTHRYHQFPDYSFPKLFLYLEIIDYCYQKGRNWMINFVYITIGVTKIFVRLYW